jgi:hypothetical protein
LNQNNEGRVEMRQKPGLAGSLTHFLTDRERGESQRHDKRQGKENGVHDLNLLHKAANCNNYVTTMFHNCSGCWFVFPVFL